MHGVGGLTGTFLAGVLAAGALSATPELPGGVSGLLEGNPGLVVSQLYGIVVVMLWSGAGTYRHPQADRHDGTAARAP